MSISTFNLEILHCQQMSQLAQLLYSKDGPGVGMFCPCLPGILQLPPTVQQHVSWVNW